MLKLGKMQYRNFGRSGLKMSVITFGSYEKNQRTPQDLAQLIKLCLQHGVNTFDTAEVYDEGKDEERLGQALKIVGESREKLVIQTKLWTSPDPSINSSQGTNKKHIFEAIKGSLKRLQLDYVDVVFAQGCDENTTIEETCRAFNDIIEDGLAFYWGTSNWDACQIIKAFEICTKYNLHKPIGAQSQYSMLLRRQIEEDYKALFEKFGYGLAGYRTLGRGYLTGKYLNEGDFEEKINPIVSGVQWSEIRKLFFRNGSAKQFNENMKKVKEIAQNELHCKLVQLAIAWTLKFAYTTTAVIGASSAQQLEECLKSVEILDKITPEIEGRINKLINTHPDPVKNWRNLSSTPSITMRPISKE